MNAGLSAQPPNSGGARQSRNFETQFFSPIDLNQATLAQIRQLPGMTDEFAMRILENRPYRKKDDLRSREIIPTKLYQQIQDRIKVVVGK